MQKRVLTGLLLMMLMFLPSLTMAWHPGFPSRAPYYGPYPYGSGMYPYYEGPGVLRGYHFNYARPRMYMRGYIDRNGEYRFDVKMRNISQYDLYNAWLLYQQLGYR
jgi:hypothetical protein